MKDIDKNILIQALDHLPVGTLIVDARQEHWPVIYMNSDHRPVDRARYRHPGWLPVARAAGRSRGTCSAARTPARQPGPRRSSAEAALAVPVRRSGRHGTPGIAAVCPSGPAGLLADHGGCRPGWRAKAAAPTTPCGPRFATRNCACASSIAAMRLRDLRTARHSWKSCSATGQSPAASSAASRVIVFQVDALDRYRDLYGKHAADSCLRKIGHAITGSLTTHRRRRGASGRQPLCRAGWQRRGRRRSGVRGADRPQGARTRHSSPAITDWPLRDGVGRARRAKCRPGARRTTSCSRRRRPRSRSRRRSGPGSSRPAEAIGPRLSRSREPCPARP